MKVCQRDSHYIMGFLWGVYKSDETSKAPHEFIFPMSLAMRIGALRWHHTYTLIHRKFRDLLPCAAPFLIVSNRI